MSAPILYFERARKAISDRQNGGGSWKFAPFTLGDQYRFSFRFLDRLNGQTFEHFPKILAVRAMLGAPDDHPSSGGFQMGEVAADGVISPIPGNLEWDATPADVGAVLGEEVFREGDSWWFTSDERRDLRAVENTLRPFAHVRVRASEIGDQWLHEIRLIRVGVISDEFTRVLPPFPKMETVQHGGEVDGMDFPEVKKLTIDPRFQGVYVLRKDGLRPSARLTIEDGPEQVAEALSALWSDVDGAEITAEFGSGDGIFITFGGSLVGEDIGEIVPEVVEHPPGDVTFVLDLDKLILGRLLGEADEKKDVPLEIEFTFGDEQDATIRDRVSYQTTVTVRREGVQEEIATVPDIDFQRPLSAAEILPYDPASVQVGHLFHTSTLTPGQDAYTIDHNLNSSPLTVTVIGQGFPAVHRTDVTVREESQTSCTLLFPGVLTEPHRVSIMSPQAEGKWTPHTHTMAEIDQLLETLGALDERLSTLEGISGGIRRRSTGSGGAFSRVTLPAVGKILPLRNQPDAEALSLEEFDPGRARFAGILPARHTSSILEFPINSRGFPESAHTRDASSVYQNQSGKIVAIGGMGGRRTATILPGEFAAIAEFPLGNLWYKVTPDPGGANTYYPADFTVPLFEEEFNSSQFIPGTDIVSDFGIHLRGWSSREDQKVIASWRLRMEYGAFTEDQDAGEGFNLSRVVWDEINPLLEQKIHVGSVATPHHFGFTISNAGGDLSAVARAYNADVAAPPPPATSFMIRCRLMGFDTEDHQLDPRGFVGVRGLMIGGADISAAEEDFGQIIIRR